MGVLSHHVLTLTLQVMNPIKELLVLYDLLPHVLQQRSLLGLNQVLVLIVKVTESLILLLVLHHVHSSLYRPVLLLPLQLCL